MNRKVVPEFSHLPAEGAGFLTRGLVLAISALVFIGVAGFYAGSGWAAVLSAVCTDGLPALLWVACAGGMGLAVHRLIGAETRGAWGVASCVGMGVGIFSLLILVLGCAGFANRATLLALALVSAMVGYGPIVYRHRSRLSQPIGPPVWRWLGAGADWEALWIVAMPFLAIAVVGACLMPGMLWRPDDPHPYDVLVYHLQVPREWFEAGKISPLTHNVFSYFPFNAEMHFLACMVIKGGPWVGMYMGQFVNVVLAIGTVVAIVGAIEKWGASGSKKSGQTLAGVGGAGLPWVVMPACVAYVESYMTFMTVLCVGWVIEAMRTRGRAAWRAYAMAGAFAGFACGSKLTAVAMVAVAVPVAILLARVIGRFVAREKEASSSNGNERVSSRGDERIPSIGNNSASSLVRTAVGCAIFAIIAAITFSPWLIRTYAWAGNPIFPVGMKALGARDFDEDQIVRFERAHSAKESQQTLSAKVIAAIHEIGWSWKYSYLLWPIALAGFVLSIRRTESWMLAILILLMLGVWMFATHLMSRFFVTAIPPALLLIGLTHWGRARIAITSLLVLCVLATWLGVGGGGLHEPMLKFSAQGAQGLFGITDLTPLIPEVLKEIEDGQQNVAMVGDSQAFLHPSPMKHLRYRTVFDVASHPGQSAIDAWLGLKPGEKRPDDWIIYVDPLELERLSRTYWKIEDLDPREQRDAPYVIYPKR